MVTRSAPRRTAVLLARGADRKGLVATITGFLYGHGANILHADQHIDPLAGMFFQRIEFAMDEMDLAFTALRDQLGPLMTDLNMDFELFGHEPLPRLAVLVSKLEHCLIDLLLRARAGELRGHIVVVASNHETVRPLTELFSVPFVCLPVTPGLREEQEGKLLTMLAAERVDLVVLARYMQILSARVVQAYPLRIINIHHSFLPAFPGARPYHQAVEHGVKLVGATSHFVTEALDEGPIIEQDVVRVTHRDTVEDLQRKGRDLERLVLARAVRLWLERRVLCYGNKTVVFD
ncbi:MAG TPA: formyltetrahydrofolate deformylase [bacterium]|nr:formyltetrahydrofolate deformylase [bacterium]